MAHQARASIGGPSVSTVENLGAPGQDSRTREAAEYCRTRSRRASLDATLADAVAHRPCFHMLHGTGAQQVHGRMRRVFEVQLAIIVFRFQNQRLPVVDWLHEMVGICSEDRKCLQRRAVLRAPALPQAGEGVTCVTTAWSYSMF